MALGWSDAASQITIEPTLMGDTDLSGTVDNNDLGQLLKYFNQPGGWAQGDFDYNGTVDNNDLGALLANFNMLTALPLELSLGGVMASSPAAATSSSTGRKSAWGRQWWSTALTGLRTSMATAHRHCRCRRNRMDWRLHGTFGMPFSTAGLVPARRP